MPPPNANGSLHIGHALFVTLEDIMIRYQRMKGKKALWLPGADHAGFETQVVYEKQLEKEGRSRFGMDRDQLYKEILDFTNTNKKNIKEQIKKIGASCDWSREKFTLDPDVVKTVYNTFKKLSDDGLVYRGRKIINWCSKHQTSLSDLETTDVEQEDKFYYLKYGPFVIATSRPETKFGDKYVVMHPDDPRYAYSYDEIVKGRLVSLNMEINRDKIAWIQDMMLRLNQLAKPVDIDASIDASPDASRDASRGSCAWISASDRFVVTIVSLAMSTRRAMIWP